MSFRFLLYLLIIISVLARMALYHPYAPMWDASAYILMGKYLATHGAVGLIEPFRPLGWPVVLGFLYWTGMDPVVGGTILQVVMTLASIVLVFRIGEIVWGAPAGFIAALLFTLSPSYVFWGNGMYSEIPAAFLTLAAFYGFVRGRYFLCGALAAFAIFFKFTQLIPVLILLAGVVIKTFESRDRRPLFNFVFGGIIGALPFLMLHAFLYGDVMYPLKESRAIYNQGFGDWGRGIVVTLKKILIVDPALILVPVGIWAILTRPDMRRWMIVAAAVLSVAWIGKMPTSIVRYALLGLPFLYLLSGYGFVKILGWKKSPVWAFCIWIALACFSAAQISKITAISFPPLTMDSFQRYVQERSPRGNIWVSSPTALVFSDLKADELMYYPVFDAAKARYLQSRLGAADLVLLDTREIPCASVYDPVCEQVRAELIHSMKERLQTEGEIRFPDGNVRAILRR